MNLGSVHRISKFDYLMLLPILALAFYIAFIPNQNYPYPVHIDEWVHIAYSNSLLQDGSVFHANPFTGQAGSGSVQFLESGFHVLFAVFYKISGVSWVEIVRYLPGIIFAFTVLSVYVLAQREGFGWEAAFFTCLIPTTVGIMGPAFFVPVALCLPFVPLSLFIIFNFRNFWSYLALIVLIAFMIITHATSAICLILILVPCVLFYLKNEPKHGIILLLIGAIPFLVTLPWTYNLIVSTAKSLFVEQSLPVAHDLPRIVKIYSGIPIGLGLLGTLWLTVKGGIKNYSLALGLFIILLMLATFYELHYGVALVYLRGILYALLILGVAAGAGLMAIKNLKLPVKLGMPRFVSRIGYPLCLALIVAILMAAIPARQNTPYYHMIDKDDYEAFVWIRDHVDTSHQKAILDPWKATPFTALTEKYVYTRTHVMPDATTRRADKFIASGCIDTAFLMENGISIVYTRGQCSNPDLVEVRKYVYLLEKTLT